MPLIYNYRGTKEEQQKQMEAQERQNILESRSRYGCKTNRLYNVRQELIFEASKNVEAIRDVLAEAIDARADLREIDLRSVDLTGMNLSGQNMSGSNLAGAILKDCNCSHALFVSADMRHVDFRQTNLFKAKLNRATLRYAKFDDANINQCDFTNADLVGVKIMRAANPEMSFFEKARFAKGQERPERHVNPDANAPDRVEARRFRP